MTLRDLETSKKKDKWIRCSGCGHKLGRILKDGNCQIEIKCHSCKTINTCNIGIWVKDEGV